MCKQIEARMNQSIIQSDRMRTGLESTLKELENTMDILYTNEDSKRQTLVEQESESSRQTIDTDFNEEDALMINESINEFSLDTPAQPNEEQSKQKHQKERLVYKLNELNGKLQRLMQEKLPVDDIIAEFNVRAASNVQNSLDLIKFVEVMPDFSNACFGYFESKPLPFDSQKQTVLFSFLDMLNHKKFKMESDLCDSKQFKCKEKCIISFSCIYDSNTENGNNNLDSESSNSSNNNINFIHEFMENESSNDKSFHDYLLIDLNDPQDKPVEFHLKEKKENNGRLLRIYFKPEVTGVYKLAIKFKQVHIDNSPFYFSVSSIENNAITPPLSAVSKGFITNNIFTAGHQVNQQASGETSKKSSNSSVSDVFSMSKTGKQHEISSITAGRGRILKQLKQSAQPIAGASLRSLSVSSSQKRKSPLPNQSIVINESSIKSENVINDSFSQSSSRFRYNEGYQMRYGSESKNQDLLDDNNNLYNEDSNDSTMKELSNSLKKAVCANEVNVMLKNRLGQTFQPQIDLDSSLRSNKLNAADYLTQGGFISAHLRKHASKSAFAHIIPPLRVKFLRKYTDIKFPIGVRSHSKRNWLIACDSSDNVVKIYERTTGELLFTIKENFKRPSAVLIVDNELYVKDDNKIFVFNIEQDFKLSRLIGENVLRRPYGLALDTKQNLVLVDADLKQPLIYTFDRLTGNVINSKRYEPVILTCARPAVLLELFNTSNKNRILSQKLAAFDCTKIRFICSNQDNLYASDLGRSIVYKTNLNGEILLAFGHHGRSRGELNEPSGIYVDHDGSAILVGDSKNDRLQVISILLNEIKFLLLEEILWFKLLV
jgi:hypothetical protein